MSPRRLLQVFMRRRPPSLVCLLTALALAACGGPKPAAVLAAQIASAHASYAESLRQAVALDAAAKALVATPDDAHLAATRAAWLAAHLAYSRTEALRFGHPPVDEWEGKVNAWPIDEGLLDYTSSAYAAAPDNAAARANLVAATQLHLSGVDADLRTVNSGVLVYLNGLLGVESNVLRGFHPIEFLLWGQDLSVSSPGERPASDYSASAGCTRGSTPAPAAECARRGAWLTAMTALLVQDLQTMTTLWDPANGSYGRQLQLGEPQEGLRRMLTGMAQLAGDELAGQRIGAGLLSHSAEDEQSCFSDSTALAHQANVAGIAQLYRSGGRNSLAALLQAKAPQAALRLNAALANADAVLAELVRASARGYDRLLDSENSAGQARLRRGAERLQALALALDAARSGLGLGLPGAPQTGPLSAPRAAAAMAGGDTTFQPPSLDAAQSRNALSQPAANLGLEGLARFAVGNSFFTQAWVPAPAAASGRDGLGPLYNAAACQNCHVRDGRGDVPITGGNALLKLGGPGPIPEHAAYAPHPSLGGQLQTRAIAGQRPEGAMQLSWREQNFTTPDGRIIVLRRPRWRLDGLEIAAPTSLRVAPAMSGLGLLEAIPEAAVFAKADPEDRNGDGISGRANRVWSRESQSWVLGRFGYKAAQPTVRQQAAAAAAFDMGLSNRLYPADDCTPKQQACRAAPPGGSPELEDAVLDALSHYARHLAPPARRWVEPPAVRKGERLFTQLGCAACHTPQASTGPAADAALAGQRIAPYTDLLLHDLGPGLADTLPEFAASGAEWRTAPLWGLHLVLYVNPQAGYLHDGRARTLEEAIVWHGGEAAGARDAWLAEPAAGREALIWFLKSL